ncbi:MULTISPECIES: hypothetical protein [unclassified Microcoleus]|uniref:hypothetical protein n=1 Tax=unclassified Microcoleus TaxID=2642155 RepID=UPI002FCFAB1C
MWQRGLAFVLIYIWICCDFAIELNATILEIGVLALAGFTAKSIKATEPEQPSKVSRFLLTITLQ